MKQELKIGDRIKAVRKYKQMTQEVFTLHIDLSGSSLSQMEQGKIKPALGTLYIIGMKHNINANWLMYGEMPMLRGETPMLSEKTPNTIATTDPDASIPPEEDSSTAPQKSNVSRRTSIAGLSDILDKSVYNKVTFMSQKAQAGYLEADDAEDYLKQLPTSRIPGMEGKDMSAFQIKGNSMDYAISHGDWVMCERIRSVWHIHDGAIYLLLTKHEFICKRVINKVREQGKLILKSDNTYYGEQPISVEDIREVWAVEAKISRDFNQANKVIAEKEERIRSLRAAIEDNKKTMQSHSESLQGRDDHIKTQQSHIHSLEKTIDQLQKRVHTLEDNLSSKKN